MRFLPRALWTRLLLAMVVALGAIAWLEWSLRAEAALAAERAAAAGPEPTAAPAEPVARAVAELGLSATVVVLCRAPEQVAEAVALWQVAATGAVVLRRPPPLPTAPGRRVVPLVAVVLPADHLDGLDPVQRAGLLDLLSALFAERPVGVGQVRLAGLAGGDAEVAALLRWLR